MKLFTSIILSLVVGFISVSSTAGTIYIYQHNNFRNAMNQSGGDPFALSGFHISADPNFSFWHNDCNKYKCSR